MKAGPGNGSGSNAGAIFPAWLMTSQSRLAGAGRLSIYSLLVSSIFPFAWAGRLAMAMWAFHPNSTR